MQQQFGTVFVFLLLAIGFLIVSQVAHGASEAEILADHPDLEPEDIRQALEYAAWLTQEEVHVP